MGNAKLFGVPPAFYYAIDAIDAIDHGADWLTDPYAASEAGPT